MYGDHSGWLGFGGGFMWVFWILIIIVIVALIRGFSAGGGTSSTPESPMEILRRRYANGEVSDEEFKQRKKELEK